MLSYESQKVNDQLDILNNSIDKVNKKSHINVSGSTDQ